MRLMLKLVVLLMLMSFTGKLQAQFEANNWNFGDSAAVSFNNDVLTYVNGSRMYSSEGCATISDACGNLLFYTNGEVIYNKANLVMQNGADGFSGHQSSTQSSIIIPKPETPNIYYVFTNDARERELINGVCYSIVDMTLDGGLGGVLAAEKNTLLLKPSSEKLTAVKHANGVDVWVVIHRYYSNQFYSYLVTKNGIQPPVITGVGSVHDDQGSAFNANSVGFMKLSPDGSKIALTLFEEDRAELFDFNNGTGVVSNPVNLVIGKPKTFGVAWSPNSEKLYINSEYDIYQFDVTAADVPASKVNVFSDIDRQLRGMQLAYDGKIYVSRFSHNRIDVINNPNLKGVACDVQKNAFALADDFTKACFPNFIQSYFDEKQKPQIIVDKYCTDSILNFKLNSYIGVDSTRWNFGDPASGFDNSSGLNEPQHIFQSTGFYNITLLVYKNCPQPIVVRTQIEIADEPQIELGNDTAICAGDSLILGKLDNTVSFKWSTGVTTGLITAKLPDVYFVEVSNVCGTKYDTIDIALKYAPTVDVLGDTVMCVNESQVLVAKHTDGESFQWSSGPFNQDTFLNINSGGKYRVDVTNDCGTAADSITIIPISLPVVNLPGDTIICTKFNMLLKAETPFAKYQWSTGDTLQSITVSSAGVYNVNVTKCGVTVTDSIDIFSWEKIQNFTPNAFSPNQDFINDSFAPVISFIRSDTNYRFVVFDRWGMKLLDTEDPTFKWDGTYNGKPAPHGMYLYIVEYRGCNEKKSRQKGSFLLIR